MQNADIDYIIHSHKQRHNTKENEMMTRQEQIEELLKDLNDFVIRSDSDYDIDKILPTVYWLEDELKEEKEKLARKAKRIAYYQEKERKLEVDKNN